MIFVDGDGYLHCRTMEKSMGYCSVPECDHALESYTVHVSFFVFAAVFAESGIVEIQKFCYHGNM